jgi:TM2 domain-containing membrane protein YozV
MRNPLIAGTLSLLIPGLGQIYNGRILVGIIWMLVFGISWIGSVGWFGLIIHVISAWCAYSFARDHPVRA